MKKQCLNFLILVIFCSYLSFAYCSNLKAEVKNSEAEKASASVVPDYSTTPRTTYLENVVHEDISLSDKMFYAKFNLRRKVENLLTNTNNVINSRLIESKVSIPINLAKLEVELYVQNLVNFRGNTSTAFPWEVTIELYFSDTLIGEQVFNYNTEIEIRSLYIQGSLFHVPAGTYQVYLRVKVSQNHVHNIGFGPWHVVGGQTDPSYNQYLIHEYGYLELSGIGSN